MPIYVQKQQIRDTLTSLARGGQSVEKWRLDVRWLDGEVAHVHVAGLAALDQILQPNLLVASARPLDLASLGSAAEIDCPLRLACWLDPGGAPVVCVVTSPATDPGSHDVLFIPGQDEIFLRLRGLIETDRLRAKRVAVFGVGSVGSVCAVELAKSGIGGIDLIDYDRLELHNVARHACGVSALGRRKVNAVRDILLDKNPTCRVDAHDLDVLENPDRAGDLVQKADVILVATDNNASRLLINSLCLQQNKLAIHGRAMTRACGMDVVRVRPGRGPCYQCLLDTILKGRPEEISGPRQANAFPYADRPVEAEPGLSNDLMPLTHLMVKLAIQQLVQGTSSELLSLNEDLTADLYIWANRRTILHRGLSPLGTQANQPTVLRWYGVDLSALPRCSLCAASMTPA